MAEGGQKRDPVSHKTPEQERRHTRGYQATTTQKKRRATRNAARTTMERAGKVSKGDGKDVDHKRPLSKGGSNTKSNLRISSRAKNRGHGMSGNGRSAKGRK